MDKTRIKFKKGIDKILIPMFAPFELKEIAQREMNKFLEKYEINKNALICFNFRAEGIENLKIYTTRPSESCSIEILK